MTDTANLSLPLIAAAQAQKHITHNEALERLDALVQLSVVDAVQAPPVTPDNGDRYICAAGATGDWAGHDGDVAAWQGGGWVFYAPQPGWRAWVQAQSRLEAFDGAQWVVVGGGNSDSVPQLGINATADTLNRLTVSSPNTLLNHEGTDHRLKINRASAADTASVLFQNDFSGRAEFGLTGDDQFRLKVSADGNNWTDALSIDPVTGKVALDLEQSSVGEGVVLEPSHSSQPMLVPYGHYGYSNTTLSLGTNYWRYKLPYLVGHDTPISELTFVVKQAGAAGARIRFGLRRWDRKAGWSFRELLFETPEVDVETTGQKIVPVGPLVVPAGWYALDVLANDNTIGLLGVGWQYAARPAFGSVFTADAHWPVNVIFSITPYGPLPADDLGTTYNTAHFSTGNFSIGLR